MWGFQTKETNHLINNLNISFYTFAQWEIQKKAEQHKDSK